MLPTSRDLQLADQFQLAAAYAKDGAERTALEVAMAAIFGSDHAQDFDTTRHVLGAVLAARSNQVRIKGFTAAHDDKHADGELAVAAALYALPSDLLMTDLVSPALMADPPCLEDLLVEHAFAVGQSCSEADFPEQGASSVFDRINDLAQAGALVLAEMSRLVRLLGTMRSDQEPQ